MRLSEALSKKTYRQRKIQHPPNTVLVVEVPVSRRMIEALSDELSEYVNVDITVEQLLTRHHEQVLTFYETLIQEQRDGEYNPEDHEALVWSLQWLAKLIRDA